MNGVANSAVNFLLNGVLLLCTIFIRIYFVLNFLYIEIKMVEIHLVR